MINEVKLKISLLNLTNITIKNTKELILFKNIMLDNEKHKKFASQK